MAKLNKTPLQIRAKRGTEAQIIATSPAPYQLEGEIAYATDNEQFYVSNGTKFNPFASMDIGTAQGQMSFWDATLGKWTYTETSEMFWDDVNKRVGIGTDSPLYSLDVDEIGNSAGDFKIQPDVQGDVVLFGDTDVGDAVDGKKFVINRKAAESDDYIELYVSQYNTPIMNLSTSGLLMKVAGTSSLIINNDTSANECRFGVYDVVGNMLILTNNANVFADHDHAAQTDPTLYIHSDTNPDTDNTQWISLTHDKTNGVIGLGSGAYTFPDGNVGIGTVSPGAKTEILSTTTQLRLTHTDGVDEADFYVNADGELLITPTSLSMYLNNGTAGDSIFGIKGATTTYTLIHDDSEGDLKVSANDATNFSKFETDGTLEFNGTATVWRDINLGSAMLAKPSSSQPDTDEFKDSAGADTGIETYSFAVGEKVSGSFEMQHDYKQGSDFTFHLHWQGIAAPTGTDNVQWRLTYTLMRDGTTLDAVTIIDSPDATIDTQYMAVRNDFAAITGTNYKIGDQFLFTLERVAATGDAYAGDALIATAGIHYQIDTIGSRQIGTK